MHDERLASSPIGQLVPINGTDPGTGRGYSASAYLPHPLPRELTLEGATWAAVISAETALARLDQSSQLVPEPALLRRPTLRQEAQSTSALEGTWAPFETVLASELDERRSLSSELREVLNYVEAAEEGFTWVRDRPITVALLNGLQSTLVANTPSERRDAGGLRESQVVIGAPGATVDAARFIPPPPGDQLRAGLERWVEWMADEHLPLPPVVRAALAHYQFETLHPYSDGNGRIGRLVIAMQLMRAGVLTEPILVVSPWFEARRQAYQDGLLELSRSGTWDVWIRFFADGIAASADATRRRVDRLLAIRTDLLERVTNARVAGVAHRVTDELIGAPILSAPQVARRHDVSPQAAMLALRRLRGLGVLEEQRIGGRVRFVSDAVLSALGDAA